jgi:hypothetical protein
MSIDSIDLLCIITYCNYIVKPTINNTKTFVNNENLIISISKVFGRFVLAYMNRVFPEQKIFLLTINLYSLYNIASLMLILILFDIFVIIL